jgi:hypothetical protein
LRLRAFALKVVGKVPAKNAVCFRKAATIFTNKKTHGKKSRGFLKTI